MRKTTDDVGRCSVFIKQLAPGEIRGYTGGGRFDMNANIELPMGKIRDFCQKWKIREFSLFGSVLRDDFRPDSDIDVLVSFADDADRSLFDRMDMVEELSAIFSRAVDLAIEKNLKNPFRRKGILNARKRIYAA